MSSVIINDFVGFLKAWQDEKEAQGYIPTVELLIEELESGKKADLTDYTLS